MRSLISRGGSDETLILRVVTFIDPVRRSRPGVSARSREGARGIQGFVARTLRDKPPSYRGARSIKVVATQSPPTVSRRCHHPALREDVRFRRTRLGRLQHAESHSVWRRSSG